MSRGGKERYPSLAGDQCASKYERDVINSLISRGVDYVYEPGEYRYHTPIRGGFCRHCMTKRSDSVRQARTYVPDILLRGSGRIVECKGYFPAPNRAKMSCFVKANRGILKVAFAFMADRKLSKSSTTRYGAWATKLGCEHIIGTEIPESWAKK